MTLMGLGYACFAGAVPVYLRVDSRFPSGNYTRQSLENRTRRLQFQRWLRVETSDKSFGWLPEEHLLTALKLSSQATLMEAVPVRREMLLDAAERDIMSKGSRVLVLEAQGSWARVRSLSTPDRGDVWVPLESMQADLTSPVKRVFLPSDTRVYVLPAPHAREQFKSHGPQVVQVLKDLPLWLEVQTRAGSGYVRKADAVSARDLGETGARPMFEGTPLRSAPLPYADLLRNLPSGAKLTLIGAQALRWGQARIGEIGEIWWPIVAAGDDDKEFVPSENISTRELFKRKIFDMASSPAIPQLKFVSAQGVFRTIDGAEWTKIKTFENKNYPIAISGNGAVFIGPYVSDDHGETFQQWIRWDSLIATLKRQSRLAPSSLQIQEIRPEDPAGRRVVLKLSIGEEALVKLVTDDQGMSWRAL